MAQPQHQALFDPQQYISMKYYSESKSYQSRKSIWNNRFIMAAWMLSEKYNVDTWIRFV